MAVVFHKLALANPTIQCITIDCEVLEDFAEKYNVKSVPSFLFFNNGQVDKQSPLLTAVDVVLQKAVETFAKI
jgi:hypothetical protein